MSEALPKEPLERIADALDKLNCLLVLGEMNRLKERHIDAEAKVQLVNSLYESVREALAKLGMKFPEA